MKKINSQQWISMFCLGLRDSMSLYWVRKILLLTHPVNKNIHPSSFKLLSTLKNTFIQVFVFIIALPWLLRYLGQNMLAQIVSIFFLILTYGYFYFYSAIYSSIIQMLWQLQNKLLDGLRNFLTTIFARQTIDRGKNSFTLSPIK